MCISLTSLRPERDDVHVVTALSSVDGAKLRVVAAYDFEEGRPGLRAAK